MRRHLPILGPLLLVGFWWLMTILEVSSPLILPSPWFVLEALLRIFIAGGEARPDLLATFARTILAFLLSCGLGIPLGLGMGYVPSVNALLSLVVDFFRSIPPIVLFPLFLTVLGLGEPSMIGVPVYGCTLVIVVNSAYGVSNAPAIRRTMATVFGFSPFRIFTQVVLPDALPHVFGGMRVALSLALVLTIVVEMILGSNSGIGRRVYDYHLLFQTPEMYSTIIVAGVLGLALNKAFLAVERRVVHWAGR